MGDATNNEESPEFKPLKMGAILGDCSNEMFKLDLQRDSLCCAHRQHSQILWKETYLHFAQISLLIFDLACVSDLCLRQTYDEEHICDVASGPYRLH